jgi:Tripartite tricarboxylate transporter TctB family
MSRFALRGSVDFYSGLLLTSVAACCIWLVSDLDIGSAREMGPAYFPLMVSIVLGAMGMILMAKGVLTKGPSVEGFEIRPLFFIVISFVAFGVLIGPAGLIVAILAQVALAHFASSETRPLESALFGVGLAAASSGLFVYLLGVPVRLLP